MQQLIQTMGQQARHAARQLSRADTATKNKALESIAQTLIDHADALMAANAHDLDAGKTNGLDSAMLDRLSIDSARIAAMAEGVRQMIALPDPVGAISDMNYLPSGIQLGKMRVPIGVIGIIYESRPNVTVDAAALCLKSGNAVILRGGSEAAHSNRALAACIQQGLAKACLPETAVQVVPTTDREAVGAMLRARGLIDVMIPRGGKSLTERVANESLIPVIKHLDGICHVYIDDTADIQKALKVAINAKTHRYGVCNAMETLLVAEAIADDILPALASSYVAKGVELRGCARTRAILDEVEVKAATEEDWSTEYLAPILSIKVVDGLDAAIAHINRHGSGHTDGIVTTNLAAAQRFLDRVDSASVLVNASTRLSGGGDYGMGAVVGISTGRLHARGPVGARELTTYNWQVRGSGQLRK